MENFSKLILFHEFALIKIIYHILAYLVQTFRIITYSDVRIHQGHLHLFKQKIQQVPTLQAHPG